MTHRNWKKVDKDYATRRYGRQPHYSCSAWSTKSLPRKAGRRPPRPTPSKAALRIMASEALWEWEERNASGPAVGAVR
jgi:hypothetical protein